MINGKFFNEFEWSLGEIVGGNICCFLKLVGIEFMFDVLNKIILLESLGGKEVKIVFYVV